MAKGRLVGTANWALPTTPEYQVFYKKFKAKCGAEPITPAPQSYDIQDAWRNYGHRRHRQRSRQDTRHAWAVGQRGTL
jgi:ABC-type branched-chain amino acid transport systems, periplasmic component